MALKIDYSLRLPEGEFFPAKRKKTGIAIHHTVGGTASSTFDYWLKDRNRAGNRRVVGTAYIIDRSPGAVPDHRLLRRAPRRLQGHHRARDGQARQERSRSSARDVGSSDYRVQPVRRSHSESSPTRRDSPQRLRDSIQAFVNTNAVVQESLAAARADKDAELTLLRNHVGLVEQQRRESQLTVRGIRKTSELQARLEETFSEMARSNWGVTSIPFEPGDTLGIEYFLIPAWFTETFIIDHQNAESLLVCPQRGEELRSELHDVGWARSDPTFHELTKRLEERGLIRGFYARKFVGYFSIRERHFEITIAGVLAYRAAHAFYSNGSENLAS